MARIRFLLITAAAATLAGAVAEDCLARHPIAAHRPSWRAQWYNWHGGYAHTEYGQPVALVVPPTANLQTNWSWGTGSSRISRIDHQFGRNWPGRFARGAGFYHTPAWPADTAHFGVYHVRAPW